jgi:hypothetical protein
VEERLLNMITKEIQLKILEWLANGRSGASSQAMAFWLGFGIKKGRGAHPCDPADFNRCLLLLDYVPELRGYLFRMTRLSPEWKNLVAEWADIELTLLNEVGLDWSKGPHLSATKTYDLMKKVIGQ